MDQIQAVELLIQSQAEQIRQLTEANAKLSGQLTGMQQRMDKLLAQIAWFTRQFYGRKSEKLSQLDPGQLSLFETIADEEERLAEIEAARAAAEKQIEEQAPARKKERSNRKMLEDLPVVEVVLEPEELDLDKYKRVGEERTRTLEFEPGKLYVKELVRPKYGLKDNATPTVDGTPGVIIAPLPLLPMAIICSLLTSCKEQGVNPREWLIDVIGKMPYYQKPGNDENLKKLLPHYWKNEGN